MPHLGLCTRHLVFVLFRTLVVRGAVAVVAFVVVVFVVVVLAIIAVVFALLTEPAITRHYRSWVLEAGRRVMICF